MNCGLNLRFCVSKRTKNSEAIVEGDEEHVLRIQEICWAVVAPIPKEVSTARNKDHHWKQFSVGPSGSELIAKTQIIELLLKVEIPEVLKVI